jgi:hypothetical protein
MRCSWVSMAGRVYRAVLVPAMRKGRRRTPPTLPETAEVFERRERGNALYRARREYEENKRALIKSLGD